MGASSFPPESGFRIEVQRAGGDGPPWQYAGHAVSPSKQYEVSAVVRDDGTVHVEIPEGAPSRLMTKVAAVVRAACGAPKPQPTTPPPERIVAWRSDGSRG
jgi:hypothetical protein